MNIICVVCPSLAMTNSAAMNIIEHICWWTYALLSVIENGLLCYIVGINLALLDNVTQLS